MLYRSKLLHFWAAWQKLTLKIIWANFQKYLKRLNFRLITLLYYVRSFKTLSSPIKKLRRRQAQTATESAV